MKKLLLNLCIVFISCTTFASSTKKIVLLTSVKHSKVDIENKLEQIFRKKLNSYPFDLKVIHSAGIEQLHRQLSSSDNDAVFWVSHGAFNKVQDSSGMTQKPLLLTDDYKNVAPLFSKINSKLQYLGVIGCNTQNIIKYYRDTSSNLNLRSFISKGKTVAQFGLKKAIRKFKTAWKNSKLKESSFVNQNGIKIKIRRTSYDKKLPALIIENSNGYISILPAQDKFSQSVVEVLIPFEDELLKQNLNLSFKTGFSPFTKEDPDSFGNIEISNTSTNFSWKLFSKPNGEAFGINSRLYIYTGRLR